MGDSESINFNKIQLESSFDVFPSSRDNKLSSELISNDTAWCFFLFATLIAEHLYDTLSRVSYNAVQIKWLRWPFFVFFVISTLETSVRSD